MAGSLTVAVNGQVYAGSVQADASGYKFSTRPPSRSRTAPPCSGSSPAQATSNGDAFNSDSSYFYTAAAVNPATAQPTIVAVSPECCDTTGLPTNTEIDIQYSQPLNASTVTNANFFQDTGPTIAYTATLVSPTVVRITPTSPYAAIHAIRLLRQRLGEGNQWRCRSSYLLAHLLHHQPRHGHDARHGHRRPAERLAECGHQRLHPPAVLQARRPHHGELDQRPGHHRRQSYPRLLGPTTTAARSGGRQLLSAQSAAAVEPPSRSRSATSWTTRATNSASPRCSFTTARAARLHHADRHARLRRGNDRIATNASFTCLYSEAMDPSSITPADTYVYSYVTSAVIPVTYNIAPGHDVGDHDANQSAVRQRRVLLLLRECHRPDRQRTERRRCSYFYTGKARSPPDRRWSRPTRPAA